MITQEMLLEMASSRDENGRRVLRPPTFDRRDPTGYYQRTIEHRRDKASYNSHWEGVYAHLENITPKREPRRERGTRAGAEGGKSGGKGKASEGEGGKGTPTPKARPTREGAGGRETPVCFDFQKGNCTRGDACKFTHVTTPPPQRDSAGALTPPGPPGGLQVRSQYCPTATLPKDWAKLARQHAP